MTPQQHLEAAEKILDYIEPASPDTWAELDSVVVLAALTHAVIALAAESGVPHPVTEPAAGNG